MWRILVTYCAFKPNVLNRRKHAAGADQDAADADEDGAARGFAVGINHTGGPVVIHILRLDLSRPERIIKDVMMRVISYLEQSK